MRYLSLLLLFIVSCANPMGGLRIGGAELSSHEEGMTATLLLENPTPREVNITAGEVIVNIKGDRLVTLSLFDTLVVAPHSEQSYITSWHTTHNDPATLYAMRRRGVEAYIDRLSFDISLIINAERVELKGLKGRQVAKRFKNIENILR